MIIVVMKLKDGKAFGNDGFTTEFTEFTDASMPQTMLA